jgi:nucleotide-binding universal stress UspA family protein
MKVVVAVDDSPASSDLVQTIERRHWPEDTEFRIVNVVEPLDADSDYPEFNWNELLIDLNKRRASHAEHICSKLRHRIQDSVEHSIVHFEIRHGDPREEIINSAAEWGADKILLGARGREICPFNSLGSVSRAVARNSRCSVEIVRRPSSLKKKPAKSAGREPAEVR